MPISEITGKIKNKISELFPGDFRDGHAVAGADEKYGLINNAGTFIVEPQYEEILFLSNGLLKAKQNNLWGIIDLKGEVIAPFVYEAIGEYSDKRALVTRNKKCGFVDEQGKAVIPVTYPFQESYINNAVFRNGYVLLKQKSKSIVLDTAGEKISFPGYEDIGLPSEGLIPVKKNKKWGYAEMNGRIKISCSYDDAVFFENGYAKIKFNKNTGMIDKSGNVVVPFIYDDAVLKEGYFLVTKGEKIGLVSVHGQLILPAEYDRIEFLTDKIISAHQEEKLLYLNLQTAKIIWQEKD